MCVVISDNNKSVRKDIFLLRLNLKSTLTCEIHTIGRELNIYSIYYAKQQYEVAAR